MPPFSIEMNQNVNSLLNYFAQWEDYKSYFPFVLVYNISFGFNTKKHKVCLTKKPKYVHCDMRFLVKTISILLCFLNGSGIAVLVFSY